MRLVSGAALMSERSAYIADQLRLRGQRRCVDGYAVPFDSNLDIEAAEMIEALAAPRMEMKMTEKLTETWPLDWDGKPVPFTKLTHAARRRLMQAKSVVIRKPHPLTKEPDHGQD